MKVSAILLESRHISLYTCSLIRLAFAHEANTFLVDNLGEPNLTVVNLPRHDNLNYLLYPFSLQSITLRRIFQFPYHPIWKILFFFPHLTLPLYLFLSKSLIFLVSLWFIIKPPNFLYRRDFLILMEYLSCQIQFPNSSLFFNFSFPVSIQLNSFDLIFSKSPKNPLILDQPCSSFWHTTFINNNYIKPSSSMGKSKPLWNSFDLLGFPFEFQLKFKKTH